MFSWSIFTSMCDKQAALLQSIHKTSSSCEAFLSPLLKKQEIEAAIEHVRGYSSPEMDGLPAALYQLAPRVVGEILHIVFEHQLRRGTSLRSQRIFLAIPMLYKTESRADPVPIVPLHYSHGREGAVVDICVPHQKVLLNSIDEDKKNFCEDVPSFIIFHA